MCGSPHPLDGREADARVIGRIGIDDVAPVITCGQFAAKAVVGEFVPVSATVWREGHDAVAATLHVDGPGRASAIDAPMVRAHEPDSRGTTPAALQKHISWK